ncbi:MAG: energy-coupling factor transporter transmembrane protein EcfT [Clostridia bacterium]|nr:energy-coupling factor transporter transmembrane protein EcfT [Clostridia bacterium]MBQ8513517.1 energy-coupling factor transporter transmembrane protein EcfT [Clostridia bacterium]
MKSDIAFGQYVEGNSVIHRLDPRAKIIIALLYIIVIFLAKSVTAFVLLTAAAGVFIGMTGISPKLILRSMRSLLFIILFTAVINIFWMTGDTLLLSLGPVKIYLEGIINAVLIVLRIMLLITATSVFMTYTTTPLALTDGLEQLLNPLKKIKVPVHEFSMMMTIALRFIPTLIDETQKIINAQTARGADFTTGSLVKRAKALVPILIPLFISAFRRADELATAMECRCYTGGNGRTRMNVLRSSPKDWVFVGCIVLLGAAVVCVNIWLPIYGLSM